MTRLRAVRLRLTRRGWGTLVVAAAMGIAWSLMRLREVALLGILCLAAVVVGVVWVAILAAAARPTVRVSAPLATPAAGEHITVAARIGHRLPLSVPLTVVWTIDEGAPVRAAVDTTRRGGQTELGVTLRLRGRHRVAVDRVEWEDRLGLATWRTRPAGTTGVDLLVLPRLLTPGQWPTVTGGEGSTMVRAGSGEPGGNLRGYRAGDPLRLVHWKQTARQGDLLVNVAESGSGARHTIMLDLGLDAYGGRAGAFGASDLDGSPVLAGRALELAVSVVATLVLEWLAGGDEVTMTVGAHTLRLRPGDADRAMLALAAAQPETDALGRVVGDRVVEDALIVTGSVTDRLRRSVDPEGGGLVLTTRTSHIRPGLSAGWRVESVEPVQPVGGGLP